MNDLELLRRLLELDQRVDQLKHRALFQQETFNKGEAAEFLRCSESQIDRLMANDLLPRARDGRPIFTRRALLRYIEHKMQEEAWLARMDQPLRTIPPAA